MTELKRASRRHHAKRMKARASRVYPGNPNAPHYTDCLQVCSCAMCGNRRKWLGPPLQELRSEKLIECTEDPDEKYYLRFVRSILTAARETLLYEFPDQMEELIEDRYLGQLMRQSDKEKNIPLRQADNLLSRAEAKKVRKGEAQIKKGQFKLWSDVKHKLNH